MTHRNSTTVSYTPLYDENDNSEDEKSDVPVRGSTNTKEHSYSEAVNALGSGRFHAVLLIVCGWANISDSAEILSVSFLLPQASKTMGITSFEKGLLTSVVFVGMLVGGFVWGSLADVQGRRQTLVVSLGCNAIFGLLSSLCQNFWLFLAMRFMSGLGVGGSMPVIFTYFSEFQMDKNRGAMVSALSTFWMLGNILTAALAWAVIPREHLGYHNPHGFSYESWRIFVALCCIPAATSMVTFLFLPKSPMYLLEKGENKKVLEVLRKIYCWNNRGVSPEDYPVQHVVPNNAERKGLIRDDIERGGVLAKVKSIAQTTIKLFKSPLTRVTLALLAIYLCLSYGYYGLWMWFPELFTRVENGGSACGDVNVTLSNDTDNPHIYEDGFYTALSNLPGNLLAIIFIDRLGRKFMLTTSLILSGVSVFFIWFLHTRIQVLVMSIVFGAISVVAWDTLNVLGVELYPTTCRSTAMGVQAGMNRIGAILGNLIFGLFIDAHCAVPMIVIAVMLAIGGFTTLTLPNTTKIALK
ncbi:synaptic vesicle glycoprotein 2C-like [Diadema antillarum]|uniref:synaptic vesicle glycoprotein 2C-like n=1 Tax=Diadema antillarum TaxID=105358 RepID=UPI003A869126